jgi:hypothetical protein
MWLELWSTSGANRIGGYPTFEAALVVVRQIADVADADAVKDLFIEVWGAETDEEPVGSIEGDDLRLLLPDSLAHTLPWPSSPTQTLRWEAGSAPGKAWTSTATSRTQHARPAAIPA